MTVVTATDVLFPVVVGLGVFFVLHVGLWRAAPSNRPRVGRLTAIAGIALAISVAASVWTSAGLTLAIWPIFWIETFVVVLYVFVYAGLARSVSATLLARIQTSGRIRFDRFAEEYAASSRFEDRLQLLHDVGLVRISEAGVTLTDRGARFARICELAARLTASRLEG